MSRVAAVGERLKSSKFGWGTVTWVRGGKIGFALDSAMLEISVSPDDIEWPTSSPASVPPKTTQPRGEAPVPDTRSSTTRLSVEALRFGIVPHFDLAALTLDYDHIKSWTREALAQPLAGYSSFAAVEGAFGTGKSHTMSVVRHVARELGFVTASVEVDGRGISLSDPAGLLMHVLHSLEFPGPASATPLLDLHLELIKKADNKTQRSIGAFDKVFSNYTTIKSLVRVNAMEMWSEAMDAILSGSSERTASELRQAMAADLYRKGINTWGDGCYVHPKRLVGVARRERGNDLIEALCAYAIMFRLAGYKGLIVTMDEFEVEMVSLTRARREDLHDVIDALGDQLCGAEASIEAPLGILVATTPEEEAWNDAYITHLLERTGGDKFALSPLSSRAHKMLASKIDKAYSTGYGLEIETDPGRLKDVERNLQENDFQASGEIRAFIKRYMFELDSRFGPPGFEHL